MFGYVVVNKPELKFKEFDLYRSYYCGLCEELKEKYHFSGQLTLSYDLTFLTLLLTGLYEPETSEQSCKCIAHPFEEHPTRRNQYTSYAADMSVILYYYKCLDDWKDDKKVIKKAFAGLLKKGKKQVEANYPKKCKRIEDALDEISRLEKEQEMDLDKISGSFGRLMAELFVYEDDIWKENLEKIGFFLGKFIYLMDAVDDIEEDIKKNKYNPLKKMYQEEDFMEKCQKILTMMMAECSKEFEKLPIIENITILRNILYAGVWCRLEQKKNGKKKG